LSDSAASRSVTICHGDENDGLRRGANLTASRVVHPNREIETMPTKTLLIAGALALTALSATPSFAGEHGHVRFIRGFRGGAVETRHVDRTATGATTTRNLQTFGGRGVQETHTTSHADGTYQSSRVYNFDNGPEASRGLTVHNNGDGTASYTRTVSQRDGVTQSKSGTIPYR